MKASDGVLKYVKVGGEGALSMWIFQCALHYYMRDFTGLLMSAISNPVVYSLQRYTEVTEQTHPSQTM